MEQCCVVQEWVIREILVASHVILVMTLLVVLLEHANLMDSGVVLKPFVQEVC